MGTDPPRTVRLDLPSWMWGGAVEDYLRAARLRVVEQGPGAGDRTGYSVQALERDSSKRPNLVASDDLGGPGTADRFELLDEAERSAQRPDPAAAKDRREVQDAVERLVARASEPTGLTALSARLALHQLRLSTAPPADAGRVARAVRDHVLSIRIDDGAPVFPHAGVHLIRRDPAVLHRTKLPAVLLRLEHDPQMRSGDLAQAQAALAAGGLVFESSAGLSDGVLLLDAYLAPLFGALTPFVWALPASRASGTVVLSLGRALPGTAGEAGEPLQLLPTRGPGAARQRPDLPPGSAAAALTWWSRRLDRLLATLSDPAVYADAAGEYVPQKHLHALLTTDQVFRRVGSIQRADRDRDARHVLLFTVLDTLERLNGRTLVEMCTLSFAERTARRLRQGLPGLAAAVLMPNVDRALVALRELQAGFYLPKQLGADRVAFTDESGKATSLGLEQTTAEYLRLLRNATHGHGSNRAERKALTNTLLVQHGGQVPHDLALIGYLYLLELLAEPTMLRRTLYAGGAT